MNAAPKIDYGAICNAIKAHRRDPSPNGSVH
jgi:hypothetical protein